MHLWAGLLLSNITLSHDDIIDQRHHLGGKSCTNHAVSLLPKGMYNEHVMP